MSDTNVDSHHQNLVIIDNFHFILCFVDRAACRYSSCKWPTWRTILFLYVYFNSLHVSSNLVFINRRINCIYTTSGCSMQVGKFLPNLHTRRSPTQSDTYQMLYWYNWSSWWWARGCSKHVENWNKRIEKELCVKLVIYKNYTEMHGQQNIKVFKQI
jgi:hypothetical protein